MNAAVIARIILISGKKEVTVIELIGNVWVKIPNADSNVGKSTNKKKSIMIRAVINSRFDPFDIFSPSYITIFYKKVSLSQVVLLLFDL